MCDRGSGSGCFFTSRSKEGRENTPDIATSPRRQPHPGVQPGLQPGLQGSQAPQGPQGLRPKDPPPMVIQGDFRKVSGISSEIFRQIETVENDHDATTAAALEAVERRGEMVVRLLEPRALGRQAAEHAKRFFALQDAKHSVRLVEIVKRPGQTLGLYIREGNGLERPDGVFISRIALESAVYNSGCLKVGDEILAVNLVDVTRMSLDDVVIIMSIPRRLVLVTRQTKGGAPLQHAAPHKPPPVVVIKKELRDDEEHQQLHDGLHDACSDTRSLRRGPGSREMSGSRSRLGLSSRLGSHQDIPDGLHAAHAPLNGLADLYYNSRPAGPARSSSTWSYQPPPPVLTDRDVRDARDQTKGGGPQHFQPYERGYPKTLESLAEKVHAVHTFYPGQPGMQPRMQPGRQVPQYYSRGKAMPRSGSDQHLPRVEYQHPPQRTAHTMLRPGTLAHYSSSSAHAGRYGQHGQHGYRRSRPSLDYASDTEATCTPSTRSSSYYYYRDRGSASATASAALSRLGSTGSATLTRAGSLRSNSLPRDHRGAGVLPVAMGVGGMGGMGALGALGALRVPSSPASARHQLRPSAAHQLLDHHYDSDSALSDLPLSRRDRVRGRPGPSPSAFTADEYRAWLQRTPSTSAIYERIRANRDAALTQQRASRLTFSAENLNLLDRAREDGSSYFGYRAPLTTTLDRHSFGAGRSPSASALSSVSSVGRSQSMRRMRQHLLELEASARHSGTLSRTASSVVPESTRSRIMEINPSEFLKYKMDKGVGGVTGADLLADVASPGVSGLLWVHLLAGRGLRASGSGSAATTPSTPSAPTPLGAGSAGNAMRDLYCVLECDRVHKARTVVRTGDLVFDWDETFELDLVSNRELDFLVYSWDPQYRHKLCYKGSVHLSSLLRQSPIHQLALKIEPRGTLYLRLRHTDPHSTFARKHATTTHPLLTRPGGKALAATAGLLFGVDLESVVNRENMSGGVPGVVATSVTLATQGGSQVPLIIRRCVEEIERRGLDIIGLYRLCGSATKKRILREAFERNARTVDLTPDNVPDINVITGVLKDYLRELPEPLFTKCLYQMMLDALTVCLPDDPEGNAKLMFSILDCLPKVNRATLIYLMDHLALVVSQSERNKMTPQNLAVCFGPVMMLQAEEGRDLDFIQTINVLRYLLEIWPCKSGNRYQDIRGFDQGSDSASDQQLLFREVLDASTSSVLTPSLPSQKAPPLPAKAASGHLTSLSRVQSSSPVVVSSPISDSSPSPSPPEEAEILIPKVGTASAALKRGPPPRIEPRRSLPKPSELDSMGNGMSSELSGTLPRQHSQPPGLPPRNSSTLQRKWSANGNGAGAPARTGLTSRPLPSPPVASRAMPTMSAMPAVPAVPAPPGPPPERPLPPTSSAVGYGDSAFGGPGSSVMDAVKNIESFQEVNSANSSPRLGNRNGTGIPMSLMVPDHSGNRDASPSEQGDQLETPTSSTGTEDSRREGEAGERGTEGDEEASDDDDDRFRSGRGSSTSVVMRDFDLK